MTRKTRSTTRLAKPRGHFRYCNRDVDRFGNERYYIRIPGCKNTDEIGLSRREWQRRHGFREEFHRVMAATGRQASPRRNACSLEPCGGLSKNYRSKLFQTYSQATQKDKKCVLNRYCELVGGPAVQENAQVGHRGKPDEAPLDPGAADKLVKYLKALFKLGDQAGDRHFQSGDRGHEDQQIRRLSWWRESELEHYRSFYAVGTTARWRWS